MVSTFLAAGVASFCFVFLKAFQQLNVVHDKYWYIVPTSLAMAASEVYVIGYVASTGWAIPSVLSIGLGAGTGCLLSMVIHKRLCR